MTGTADDALNLEPLSLDSLPHIVAVDLDPDAEFTLVYRRHRDRALRLAYLLTGDSHRAEEVVAEAFSRVFPRWRKGRIQDLPAYVRRAVVNEVRRAGRRSTLERTERQRRSGSGRGARSPEDEAVERELVVRALASLPVRQRAAVVLRFYEDLPEREVAAALGTSVGTVKAQVSRGLVRLRGLLEERP